MIKLMKWLLPLVLWGCSCAASADELEKAYQKEYAYLVAEKKALSKRLKRLQGTQRKTLKQVKAEIAKLQGRFLSRQNITDRLNREIVEASRGVDDAQNNNLLLETTLMQARETLKKAGKSLDSNLPSAQQLQQAFGFADEVLQQGSLIRKQQGRFYLPDGDAVQGEILLVGNIARYGVSGQSGGILAPAGQGYFKVWDALTLATAQALLQGQHPDSVDVFLFDNQDKAMERKEEKSFSDDVAAGGLVGQVILGLGALGVLLVLVRIVLLLLAGSNVQKLVARVNDKMINQDRKAALALCKKQAGSASKVIAATLRNLEKDRDHIEDIISENILHESGKIDRFGSMILVIAAISPLLGLLGTVTGMISTFDIITEFGTGDPKLLSSGISEALVTTKFGLIVAIPMLLLGNILSAWANRQKNDLEQAALQIINRYKQQG